MMNRSFPTRSLREHSDPDQLRRQAKELLQAFRTGAAEAVAEVNAHYQRPYRTTFALHDAQLVLARAYGFESWPKLKAYVDGANVRRMVEAVRSRDIVQVRALLKVRPELARMSHENLQVLHYAVLQRSPEMARVLMEHGAIAREGVYPHRDATSALTIARERGYDEIAALLQETAPVPTSDVQGWAPLHRAAQALDRKAVAELLDDGADAAARGWRDFTPLDLAAYASSVECSHEFAAVASLLSEWGAPMTARAAVALGDADWLRARHDEGTLSNPIEDAGGLLSIAIKHNRPDILALLLDLGFDPDERARVEDAAADEVVSTQGMPLWHCASTGKYEMAEMLLRRGADPNAAVYASGTPLYQAYGRRDRNMVELLERHGGAPDATLAGLYRQTGLAKQLVAKAAGKPFGEELLWAAACGGDPEIVRMALELVDWPRDDPRWFRILEQPLRIWNHGSGFWSNPEWDRGTYVTCFRQILERCDPNVRGRFGLTSLHSVAGSRGHVTAEERVAFATALLDAGARMGLRDDLLLSTALGWSCRWGRIELVKLLLAHEADPVEADAEPWASPRAWARKMGHEEVLRALEDR